MNKSLIEIVEERLREAQAKKTFKDSEIRVGGSRKEKAMLNKLSQFTLDDLNFNFADFEEATVIPFIVKSKVFPAFNFQKEIGCTSGAAFYKSKIRDAFPAKPLYLSRPALKAYIGFGGLFYEKLLSAPTLNRVMEEVGKISAKSDYYLPKFVFGDNMSTVTEAVEILLQENGVNFDLRKEFVNFDDLYQYYLEAAPKISSLSEEKHYILNEYFLFNLAIAFMPDFVASLTRNEKVRLPDRPNKYFLSFFFKSRFGNIIDVHYDENEINPIKMAYSESAAKAIFQANEYDQLTEAESQILIQKAINPLLDRKAKYEKEYALAAAAKDVYEFDDLIQSEQIKDYLLLLMFDKSKKSGARKSLRNLYNITQRQTNFAKLDNLEDKKYYISRYLVTLEMWIKSVNDQIEKIKDKFKPRSEDWSWAEKEAPTGGQSTKPKKQAIHSKEVLTHIERKGGLLIDKNRLSNIEAINDYLSITFGFRAFEYGASLPDREAKEILFHFLGAMSDISEILNLDFATLNRRCGLSMGFGSRGRGRAKAHYEPLARIINLTRSNGDGSVAHELAHFIDNQVPRLDHPDNYNYLQYATENNNINPSGKHHRPGDVKNPTVASVFFGIMRYIVSGNTGISTKHQAYIDYEADASRVVEGTVYKIGDDILFGIRAGGIGLENLVEFIDSTPQYSRYFPSYEQTPKSNLFLYDYIISKLGVDKYTFKIKSERSVYFADSANVGGDYWTTNTELFARAFETYVFDKLKNAGRYNNFLTSGEFEDETAVGRPYPNGEQRKTLYFMFDKMIEVMKEAYAIPDFQPFTEEKNIYFNEIINISENKPEKHKKDFELKMATLLALLKAEKPEMGVGGDLEKEMTTKGEGILLFWELGKLAAKHNYNEVYLELLNQFFAVHNVPEILKQMRLIYSSVIKNAGLEAYGNTMMTASGYKIIELFEEMTPENQTDTLNKVSILQRVIDVCILVRSNEEINKKEAGSTYRGFWWRAIEKTYFQKREADFKKPTQKTWEAIHAETKFAASVIFDDNAYEGHDLHFCNELESEYDTFLKAKKHGFDKIAHIDEYGRAKYPLKEIMKEEFKLKALEASIEISQLPNGEYVNGFRLGDSTSGSFSGPSIYNRPFATIQEAIKDFYVGTRHYFRGNFPYTPAVYSTLKALYKMIHERLNISPADIEEQTVLDNEKLAKLSGKSEKPQTAPTAESGGELQYDKEGNMLGDGSWHVDYDVFDFFEYPEVSNSVSKSASTESVYVTYHNSKNDKSITLRFSNHANNAVKFGDQLNGYTASKQEVMYFLGLIKRTFMPKTKLSISWYKIPKKDMQNYEMGDKTLPELYALGEGADISKYKGKLAKDSNALITGDKVELVEETKLNAFGQQYSLGKYIYHID